MEGVGERAFFLMVFNPHSRFYMIVLHVLRLLSLVHVLLYQPPVGQVRFKVWLLQFCEAVNDCKISPKGRVIGDCLYC